MNKQIPEFSSVLSTMEKQQTPYLLGVRHHSPTMAYVLPKLLDNYQPDLILVELPTYFKSWLHFVAHKETQAPIALAAHYEGKMFSFYPFADFSPELAAIRWAFRHSIPIYPCDHNFDALEEGCCPVEVPQGKEDSPEDSLQQMKYDDPLLKSLLRKFSCADFSGLWDRLIECGEFQDIEEIRRTALLLGWALRVDTAISQGISQVNFARETFMRQEIQHYQQQGYGKIAVVIGAFHAAALLEQPLLWEEIAIEKHLKPQQQVDSSLIPYNFELLDSRSGYPAGIRDPRWRQLLWHSLENKAPLDNMLAGVVSEICREIRAQGHSAGTPDAIEVIRMTKDLCSLRGIANLGRQEFLETLETCLLQGQLHGRGQIVAKCLQKVLVGEQRGKLCSDVPRCGLYQHINDSLKDLKLSTWQELSSTPKEIRLDPLRSALDERRQVFCERLFYSGISMVEKRETQAISITEPLTHLWVLSISPIVEAQVDTFSVYGITLEQVCQGMSWQHQQKLEDRQSWNIAAILEELHNCCKACLVYRAQELLESLVQQLHSHGNLNELMSSVSFLEQIKNSLIPGFTTDHFGTVEEQQRRIEQLYHLAIKALEGLQGSEDIKDLYGISELVRHQIHSSYESVLLGKLFKDFSSNGSSLIQGISHVALILLEQSSLEHYSAKLVSLFQNAHNREGGKYLCNFLRGSIALAPQAFTHDPQWLDALFDRIDTAEDHEFLQRLLFLRRGFMLLSSNARQQLMEVLKQRHGSLDLQSRQRDFLKFSPEEMAVWAQCDLHATQKLAELFSWQQKSLNEDESLATTIRPSLVLPTQQIPPVDRYALILGQQPRQGCSMARRVAGCLQELYGTGQTGFGPGQGGSATDESFPTVREWKESLEEYFSQEICEEILAEAAQEGRISAILELPAEHVSPSIDLLETVLSLKGAASPSQLAHLKKLADSIIERLVKELANKISPALNGLTMPRPTIRNTGKIHFKRTLEINLRNARQHQGKLTIVPERLLFRTKMKKSLDWNIILVVDVSGSMERSVIHSAMMASILARLPAVAVNFVTFSTEVIDFSSLVTDPLELLFEVSIGGGTLIGKGLQYARSLVKNPYRTMVVLISDFEEGGSVSHILHEVRALHDSGCKLIGLAALDEVGKPRYNKAIASQVVECGMPCAALTPLELVRWISKQIRG